MLRCCKCNHQYEFLPQKGELELPVVVCPRCGYRHTVEFKGVKDDSPLSPVEELKLVTAAPQETASRYLASDKTPLADDDASVTDYNKSNEFILVFQMDEAMGPWDSTYTLQWRNATDEGTFADLAATGEMAWGTNTDLVNGQAITSQYCQQIPSLSTWQNGEEVEGAATSDSINLADEYYTEVAWAVDPSAGHNGDDYEFRVWENAGGSAVGTVNGQLTLAAGGTDYPWPPDETGYGTDEEVIPSAEFASSRNRVGSVVGAFVAAAAIAFSPVPSTGTAVTISAGADFENATVITADVAGTLSADHDLRVAVYPDAGATEVL
jgi:DNA-directed RNA polymerase subunit RPC12/RpoP